MADFLQQTQREINQRLEELKPLVDEYKRLRAADAALDGIPATNGVARSTRPSAAPRKRRAPGRPRGSRTRTGTPATAATTASTKPTSRRTGSRRAGRPGRPKGGGKRAAETLKHVTAQPGITIPELASKMGIKQNYLYRVLPTLKDTGSVVKRGRGWHPKGDANG